MCLGKSAAGSAMCYNPATAATPSGSATAMGSGFHHAGDGYELVIDRYLHNDQLGSPSSGSVASLRFVPFRNGMSDASGNLLCEIDYLDYGEPVYMPLLASPPQDDITNSVYDSGNKTTLFIGISRLTSRRPCGN
ncbi:MAG: hypothetical protein IPK87_10015 [Planctomycetes bacterium]|nr:hypothetical protein [Planctomycetota bacterium]